MVNEESCTIADCRYEHLTIAFDIRTEDQKLILTDKQIHLVEREQIPEVP